VVGEKPALAGGTMAIPDDFVRQRKYVRADEVAQATLAMSNTARAPKPPHLARPEVTQQFALLSVDNPMALTLEQATAKQGHKVGWCTLKPVLSAPGIPVPALETET